MNMMHDYKQNKLAVSVLLIGCLATALGATGCQQQDEGTAEKAGKKIDRAAEEASQKIESAKESLKQKTSESEEYLNRSIDSSKEKLESVAEDIEAAQESVADKAETAGEYVDDALITAKVKAAFLDDPLLNALNIEVTTVNGVVTLSGTVDSEASIGKAVELASSQENVKSVETDLIVNLAPSID